MEFTPPGPPPPYTEVEDQSDKPPMTVDLRTDHAHDFDLDAVYPGRSIRVILACSDTPTHRLVCVFTKQAWRRPEGWPKPHGVPVKQCGSCKLTLPLPLFLKYGTEPGINPTKFAADPLRDLSPKHYHIWDSPFCHSCQRPAWVRLWSVAKPRKKNPEQGPKIETMMKFVLTEEDGQILTLWDPKDDTWKPSYHAQVRRMKPWWSTDPLMDNLRLQPYDDRKEGENPRKKKSK